jgi:type II secretory pathway component GspD/PulD (secretin)
MKRKWIVWAAALQLIALVQVTRAAQELIDLEFNGARVQDVLQVLRRLGDFNIVTDPQVTGEVTVFLKQVTVREAVGLVAQAAGYSYRFEGNTMHIGTEQRLGALFAPSANPASQKVHVIKLNHADPEGLANVIRTIEPNATVTVDAFTRSLVVSGSDRAIASVRHLIPSLDTIQRQVLVEARLVEISLESLERLGLTWDLPSFALSLKRGVSLSMTSDELGVALEALSTDGSAHVLANPKIAAVNATTATFLIGDRIPIMMQQTDDLGRVTGFLEFIEAGISLAITPIIGDDGFVTL